MDAKTTDANMNAIMEDQLRTPPEAQRIRVDSNRAYQIRTLPRRGYRSVQYCTRRTPITAIVGQVNVQRFPLYVEDLASVSNLLAAHLPGCTVLLLPQLEPAAFEIFRFWLDNRTLLNKHRKPYNEDQQEIFPFMELLHLYVFASRYDIPQFREDVFKAFVANTDERPFIVSRADLDEAYAQRHHLSPMKQFIEDRYIFERAPDIETPSGNTNPPSRPVHLQPSIEDRSTIKREPGPDTSSVDANQPPPRPVNWVVKLRTDKFESDDDASSEGTLMPTSPSSGGLVQPAGPGCGTPPTRPLPAWLAFMMNWGVGS